MKILIDMNLSPAWVPWLKEKGLESVHWSAIGKPNAPDHEIMNYASSEGFVVFTHDLDFGAILATSQNNGPSVVQVRSEDISPVAIGEEVVKLFAQFEAVINKGALVVLQEDKIRVRILPLGQDANT